MKYEGSLYRPPSEARSLILQATIGCSHNKCSFCSMYKDKKFRIRKTEDILKDIESGRQEIQNIKRVFLADGDALIIKTQELIHILDHIKSTIPECERIGVYASPKSVMTKSLEDLILLKSKGLNIAYLGLESGSDKILDSINKGVSSKELVDCGRKLKEAGIMVSLTLISGIGGSDNWKEHAEESAKAVNKINPDYLGLLTLMVEEGTDLKRDIDNGDLKLLSQEEVAKETILLLRELDSEGTVFRSNHASNYVPLKGRLNMDREKMIHVLKNPPSIRDEWMRKL